jgi:hypothetical protein
MKVANRFPELGIKSEAEVRELLKREIGHPEALEDWQQKADGHWSRVLPPRLIYQVCAGNLEVSAWMGIWLGLLLGSHLVVKTATGTMPRLARFLQFLPPALRECVRVTETHDPILMKQADAVVVFGSASTVETIRQGTRIDQRFIAYGPQVSVVWLEDWNLSDHLMTSLAHDVVIYDQAGCLSPQAVFGPVSKGADLFCEKLAQALEAECRKQQVAPHGLTAGAMVQEFRDVARARGDHVWTAEKSTEWTLALTRRSEWEFSAGYRTLWVKPLSLSQMRASLELLRNQISTVGLAAQLSPRAEKLWIELGVKRFCPLGRMQHPPLSWHHDGRPVLSDLVTWVDRES